ncbi:MAG: OpgC family protein [Geminicoccaceae bacterium]
MSAASLAAGRDPRLDVFRGLAMAIILVAHVPGNPVTEFIPARFGPSDAAEMFVFCSGFASAIAFGGTFGRAGFVLGTLRIAHRCWQIYWSHLALFVSVAALCVAGSALPGAPDYIHALWLQPFFAEPRQGLLYLVTLTYVPNYFDILPMYLVVLAMVPGVMALARLGPPAALAACITLYIAQLARGWNLPAEWWSERPWFFDPFAWQLLFFAGFAFGRGWLPAPPQRRWLLWLSIAFILLLVPVSWRPLWIGVGWLEAANHALAPWADKTHFGPLRLLHFLALAYLALWSVQRWPWLVASLVARAVATVGQQALPVFLWSMCFAQALGMALDQAGRGPLNVLAANLLGLLSLLGVAHLARLVKSQPWRHHAATASAKHAPPWRTVLNPWSMSRWQARERA